MGELDKSRTPRQPVADRPGPTRGQVAKRLGKNVSWVRRREGSLLNPVKDKSGIHRFDEQEVEGLVQHFASEFAATLVDEEKALRVRSILVKQLLRGQRMSVESVAEHVGLQADAVRRIYKSWSAERRVANEETPQLLSRTMLLEADRREVAAINRDYNQRMAQFEAETDEWTRKNQEAQNRRRAQQERADRARDTERRKWLARQLALIAGKP